MPVPGTGDVATFNNSGNGNTLIDLGTGVTVSTILFNSANVASYIMGSGTLNSQVLTLNNGGAISMNSNVLANQLFNATLVLGTDATAQSYTITNNSTTNSLIFAGDIYGGTGGTVGAKTLTLSGSGAINLNGAISNGGSTGLNVTKTGSGTLRLAGGNIYSGLTTIQGGIVLLNGDTGALADGSGLTFSGGGGIFNYQAATAGSIETIGALSFSAGAGNVQSTYGGAGTSGLVFSSLAARTAGATGNFVASGGTNGSTNSISFTTIAAGFQNQGLFFNGADYAFANAANGYIRGINYGTDANTATVGAGTTIGSQAGNHVQITGNISGQTTLSSINTLKINGASNLTIVGGNTLTLSGGGLLKAGGGSALIVGGTIATSTVTELVIRADQSTDVLNIGTVLSGALTGGLTITGAGTVNLSQIANTFTGSNIYVNGATLRWIGTNSSADVISLGAAGARTITVTNSGTLSPTITSNPTASTKTFVIGTGGGVVNVATGVTFTLDDAGQFSGTGDLTVTGTGTGIFNVGNATASAFTGNIAVNSGTLQVRNGVGALGTTTNRTLTIASGASLDILITGLTALPTTISGFGVNNVGAITSTNATTVSWAAPITMAAHSGIGSTAAGGLTLTAAISGAFDLMKLGAGAGAVTLSGLNTYTGNTIVSAGVLIADSATNAAPINSASGLVFSGSGTFRYTGLAANTRSMTLNGLTLAGGSGILDVNNTGTSTTLVLGSLTRASGGGSVDFRATTGTVGTTSLVNISGASNLNGIVGGFATVNSGANLAALDGSQNIVAYSAYTDITTNGSAIASNSVSNVRINTVSGTGNNTIGIGTTDINTLFQNTATAVMVDTSTGTLRFGTRGGIVTSSVASTTGTVTLGTVANFGTVTAGGAADTNGEIIVNTTTANTVTINSVIADNGTGVVSLSMTGFGAGTLSLGGTNTYTGVTSITGGTVQINSALGNINTAGALGRGSVAGSAADLVINGGTLQLSQNAPTSTDRLFSIGLGGATLLNNNGTAANTLSFTGAGAIGFNGQSGPRTLTLSATNTGNNLLTPVLGDNGGPTTLVKAGAGTWVLTGTNTYSGITTVSAGTLQIGNGGTVGSLGTGAAVLTGTLAFNRSDNITVANPISGTTASAIQQNAASTLSLTGANINVGALRFNNVDGGTIDITSNDLVLTGSAILAATTSGTINGTGGGRLLLGVAAGDVGAANGKTLTINSVIADGNQTSLDFFNTNNGTGVVVLTADNTWSGTTNLQSGIISVAKIGNSGVAGNLGTNLTFNIGTSTTSTSTLKYTGSGETNNRVINLAGTTAGASIDQSGSSGLLRFTANLTATGAGAKTLTLTGSTAGTGEISGVIVDNTANANTTSIAKNGTGTWTLSGANTHTGTTVVNGGALIIGALNAVQNSVISSTVTNSTTSGLVFKSGLGGTFSIGGLGGSQALALVDDTGTALTSLTIGGTNTAAATYSGALSGTTPITKIGTFTQTLTGVSTYTGKITITGGILAINNELALGSNPASLTADQLTLNGGAIGAAANNVVTIDDTNRGIAIGSSGGTFDAATAGTLVIGRSIAGGLNAVTKSGAGVVIFSQANTYGATTITGGILMLTGAGTLGGGALTLNGGSYIIPGPSAVTVGSASSGSSLIYNQTSGAGTDISSTLTFTAGGNLGVDVVNSAATVTYATAFGNSLAAGIFKMGAGTLTLAPATSGNTFTGTTTIGAGTLALAFNGASVPATNIIAPTSALSMRGGTLSLVGASGATNSQTFASTALLDGGSTLSATQNSATSLGASLGAISRDGTTNRGTINFVVPTSGNYATSSTNNSSGILGGWATVAGTSWATNSGGNIIAYTADATNGNLPASGSVATTNYVISGTQTVTASQTANAVRITTTGLTTTINASQTLTLSGGAAGAAGGILLGVAAHTIGGTGTLTAGTGNELAIYTTSGSTLTINAVLAGGAITKSGPGTLTLGTSTNTFNGALSINGGTVSIDNVARVSSASGITINGGTLTVSSTLTTDRPLTVGLNGASFSYTGGAGNGGFSGALTMLGSGSRTLTFNANNAGRFGLFSGVITDSGGPTSVVVNASSDTGLFQFSGSNSAYTGSTTINRGVLRLNAANALPPSSNLVFNGGANRAILEFNATYGSSFTAAVGTLPGQVQWLGNGGFSSSNVANFIVNLGGNATPSTLVWNSGGFVPTGSSLLFAQASANQNYGSGSVTFQNPIDLAGASRTVDVGDNSNQNEATLSGVISGSAGSALNKTGLGNLTLSANNTGSTNVGVTVASGGGSVIFTNLNAIPGTGANITVTGGSVVLTGSTNPLLDMGSRIVTSSTGSILLDTNSSATLDFSSFSALSLGAYTPTMGQSVIFTGSINPNSNTYRLSTGRSTAFTAAVTGNTLINYATDTGRNALVLPVTNQLPDGASPRSLVVGAGATYITSYNTFTGGTRVGQLNTGQVSSANLTIGHDAALGSGQIQFSPSGTTTAGFGFIAGTNGDRIISNNVAVGQAGNWVSSGNLASDGVTNSGAVTYAGTTALAGAVNIFARTMNSIFLGDITATATIAPQVTGAVSFLTTPTGAVNKSFAQAISIAIGGNLIIDSNASLGSGTNTLTIGTGTAAATNTFLRIQHGTSAPVVLTGRAVAIGANFQPVFDVPGGPVTGVSSNLVLPGVVSGSTTALVAKIGTGTLTLRGANTFNGTNTNGLQIFGGTLLVDSATTSTAVATNSTTTALTLGTTSTATAATFGGGGTFSITAGANTTNQTFTNLTVTAKDNALSLSSTTGAANLTFNGATFDRPAVGGSLAITTSGTTTLNLTATNTTVGGGTGGGQIVLDSGGNAYAYINNITWAARDNSNKIVGLGSANAGSYTANTVSALSGNADMILANPTTTLAANTSITSLRFNAAGDGAVALNGNNLITGGILIGSGAGTNNQAIFGTGTLQGVAGKDLLIIQANTSGDGQTTGLFTINSTIADNASATGLTKSGAGTLVLGGTNTFTGSIYLNSGVLSFAASSALGAMTSGATNMIMNGGTLRYTGSGSSTTDRGATFNSYSTINIDAGGATPGSGTLVMTGTMAGIAPANGSSLVGLLNKTGAGTLSLSGSSANTNLSLLMTAGALNLDKTGVTALSGGTGAAALIVAGGTVKITGTGGDQINNGSAVVVRIGGTFDFNGQSETFDALAGGGSLTNTGSNGAAITLTLGDATIAGAQTMNSANTSFAAAAGVADTGLNSFSGNITDNGTNILALTKAGPGTQILSGTGNNYSGDTTVISGKLLLRATNVLPVGSGKGNVNLTGNTVIFGMTVPGVFDMGGFNQSINGLTGTGGGSIVTNTPANTINANQTNTLTVGNNDVSSTFDGIFQDGYVIKPGTTPVGYFGLLSLTKTGAGVLTLTGTSTNTGGVTINNGRIDLNNPTGNALSTNITVNSGGTLRLVSSNQINDSNTVTVAGGSFDIAGRTETVGVSLTGGSITDSLTGGVLSSSAFDLQAGTVSAVLGGSSGLAKSGSGSVTLSAINTYTGATTTSGSGSLLVTGQINNSSGITLGGTSKLYVNGSTASAVPVTVASGTTLGGQGTVNGTVTVNSGGIIEAGQGSSGSLSVGTLNFTGAATLNLFNLDGTASILNILTGLTTNASNAVTINITNSGSLADSTGNGYKIISVPTGFVFGSGNNNFLLGSVTGVGGRTAKSLNYVNGDAVYLTITAANPVWSGLQSSEWSIGPIAGSKNWTVGGNPDDYIDLPNPDTVVFDDTALGTTIVDISVADLSPNGVSFNFGSTITNYTLQGSKSIIGTTSLVKSGIGTLTINNANSFTGGVVINGGVIKLGNAAAIGTGNALSFGSGAAAGTKLQLFGNNATVTGLTTNATTPGSSVIENGDATTNSILTVNLSTGTNTFAGVLQDASAGPAATLGLTKQGAGTLILTGSNTATGGNIISAGTLQIGNGGSAGALAGSTSIASGSTLAFNLSNSLALYAGDVSGSGVLIMQGGGTLSLTGNAAHTGGTTIASGSTLRIGNGGASGALSGTGTISNSGMLAFLRTGSSTVQGNISGTGGLTVGDGTTAGTLILTGSNIYSGATLINANATLQIGNAGASGTIGSGAVTTNGNLAFNRTDSVTVSGAIAGTGSIQTISGLVTLTGINNFAGGATINSGSTLVIGNGTSGSILGVNGAAGGNITSNGTLSFNRTGTFTWDNQITGSGGATITGGNWTFTNTNSYSGTTNVAAGTTLTVGAGGTTGSFGTGSATITGGLIFNRTNSYTMAAGNLVTGPGSVTLGSSGSVVAAVDSQFNTSGALILGATNGATTVANLDLTNSSSTFGSLNVQTNSATPNIITIGLGKTLTFTGGAAAVVTIGANSGVGTTTNLNFVGGGNLSVNRAGGTFQVGGATGGTNTNNFTVDMSGLTNFTVNLGASGVFRIGDANTTSATTTAIFNGALNSTITASIFGLADNSGELTNAKIFNLGGGTNVINANTISIGETSTNRGVGVLQFSGSGGTLTMRSATGATGTANLNMINSASTTTGQIGNSQLLLNGHTVDISLNNIVMSARSAGTTAGSDATLSFDTGTLSANTLSMVTRSGTTLTSGSSTGIVNIGGTTLATSASLGVVTMTTNSVTSATSTGAATATFNINGIGTTTLSSLNMANNSVGAAASTSTSTATLNIGTTSGAPVVSLGTVTMSNNTAAATSATNATSTITIAGGSVTASSIVMANTANTANVSTATINLNGGTLTLGGNISTQNGAGTENSTLTINGGILDMGGFSIGAVTAGSGATSIGTLNFQSGGLKNVLEINGGVVLTKTTTGTLTLDGTNSYTGGTAIQQGRIVTIGVGNMLGTGAVTLGNATNSGILQLGNVAAASNLTLSSLSTSGNGTTNAIVGGSTSTSILSVNQTVSTTFAGNIGGAGTNENNLGVTKSGPGSLVISGTSNTYTGGTIVNAGTLSFTGNGGAPVNTSGITVAGGATLLLNNGIGQAINNLGILDLASGAGAAVLGLDLGSTSAYDSLNATGAATTANTVRFNLAGLSGFGVGTYNLLNASSGLDAATYSLGNIIGMAGLTLNLTRSATSVQLNAATSSGDFFWKGGAGNTSWLGLDGVNTNFSTDTAGTQATITANGTPGASSAVIFSVSGQTGTTLTTTLDAAFTIKDLTFNNQVGTGPLGTININAGTGGSLSLTNGINAQTGAPAAINLAAPITLAGNQTWTVSDSLTVLSSSGGISGAGINLTKAGAGRLVLLGTNSYSGITTVSEGILAGGAASAFSASSAHVIGATGALALNGFAQTIGSLAGVAGAIVVNGASSTSVALTTGVDNTSTIFAGSLADNAGTLGLTKVGTGTLTLSGANTYTGNTSITGGGALTLATGGSLLGNGTTTAGSQLNIGNTGTGIFNLSGGTISTYFTFAGANAANAVAVYNQTGGSASYTRTGTGDNINYLSANATGYGYMSITGGTTSILGRINLANLGTGVAYIGGTGVFNNPGEWMMISSNGGANALGQLTVGPGGLVDRTGATNYTGLFLTGAGQYGVINIAGGTFTQTGTNASLRFGNGNGGNNNTALVNLAAGTLAIGANMSQSVGTSTGQNVYLAFAGGTLRANAALTAALPSTVTGQTVVTAVFGAINNSAATGDSSQNFSGGLKVDTNNFAVSLTNSLNGVTGSGVAQSSLTVTGGSGYVGAPAVQFIGGTLAAGGSPAAGYALISGGQVTGIVITSPGQYTSAPTVTLTGGGGTGASVSVGTLVANTSGGLTKVGLGTLTLSAPNTYDGLTTISQGEVVLSANTATLGSTAAGTVVQSGAQLRLTATNFILNENLTLSGSGTSSTGAGNGALGMQVNSGIITYNGSITLNGGATLGSFNAGTATMTVVQGITGTGDLTIRPGAANNGTSNWILQGQSSYTGDTIFSTANVSGTATISNGVDNALPTTSALFMNGTAGSGASTTLTYVLNGFNQTIAGLSGTNGTSGAFTFQNTVVGGSAALSTLTVNNTTNYTFGGTLGGTGTNENNLALTKSGAGTFTLTGANTYSSATSVSGGTLSFSSSGNLGDASATNTLSASGGSTLSYTGAGAVDLGVNRKLTVGSGGTTLEATQSTGVLTVSGGIVNSTGSLTKTGPGSVVISGTINLNGATATVSDGKLTASFGASGISALNIGATGNMNFQNAAAETLSLSGALSLANGSRLGFDLGTAGNPGTSDQISSAVAAVVANSAVITLDFTNLTDFGAGTYNLISASSGGLLGADGLATYMLGTGISGFKLVPVFTDTLVSLNVTPFNPIYWRGGQDTSWNTLGATTANWVDSLGVDSTAKPGSTNTVVFSATGSPFTSSTVIDTTLDAAFTIDSLQFNSTPATITAVSIAAGTGGSLTLTPTSSVDGIQVQDNAGTVTISAPLTVGANQTWSSTGTNSALILSGSTTFNANVSKTGAGSVTLSGSNTGAGAFSLIGGTLNLNNNNALGTGTLLIGAGTTLDNTSAGTVTLATNNVQNWNGSFTFTGTQALNLGTGAVTLTNNITLTTTANTLTIGGAIGQSGGTRSLTKVGGGTLVIGGNVTIGGNLVFTAGTGTLSGATNTIGGSVTASGTAFTMNGNSTIGAGVSVTAGTATMNGTNSITGSVAVTGGTLTLGGANTISGGVTLNSGLLNIGNAGALGTNTFTINGGTIDATVAGAISTNNAQTWNGSFTFTGTNDLNLGTGAVTLGATSNVTVSAGTLTVGGSISGAGFGLSKAGTGTLVLSGLSTTAANNFSGNLTLDGGTTNLTSTASLSGGLVIGAANASTTSSTLNLTANSLTVGGATVVQTNSTSANVINIGNSQTLRLNGAVTVGASTGPTTTRLTVSGGGTLTIGAAGAATNANVQIGNSATDSQSNGATWNMSGLSTFYANLGTGTFRLGDPTNANGTATAASTVIFANTTTVFATTITSDSPAGFSSSFTQAFKLGSGTNEWNANTITIGGSVNRSSGSLDFNTGTGTLKIRALDGASRATMNIQNGSANTASNLVGLVDLTGHTVNLLLGTVAVGGRSAATSASGTGSFSYDAGTIDTTTFNVGFRTGTTSTSGNVTGTLTIGGGTSTVGTITLATNSVTGTTSTTGSATGTLNISGGTNTIATLTMATNSQGPTSGSVSGDATANVNISGGTNSINTLTMGVNTVAAGFATGSDTISTLTISGGSTTVNTTFTMGAQNSAANAATTVNTATSTLNISAGSLTLAGSTNLTMGQTTLDANNAATASINITGGTLTVGGNIQYTDGLGTETNTVTLNGGVLDMTNGNIGSATALITFNAQSGTLQNVAQINAGAGLTKTAGSGTNILILEGNNTYTGGTIISAGTLQVGTGATTGILGSGNITNNATLTINRSNAYTVANNITGVGNLIQIGSGATTLTGSNDFTGKTSITGGTLSIDANTRLGTVPVSYLADQLSLSNGGRLQITGTTTFAAEHGFTLGTGGGVIETASAITVTINGLITGSGSLTKESAGILVVTSASDFSGGTTVNGGTLQVGNGTSGSLTGDGSLTVNGGTLAGSGSIAANTSLGGSSVLAPGQGNATLDNRTLTFTAASATALQVANGAQIQLGISNPTNNSLLTYASNKFLYNGSEYNNALSLFTAESGALTNWNIAPVNVANHDFIRLTGAGSNLVVNGSIVVQNNGFSAPAYGQVFNLIDWTQVSGSNSVAMTFDTANLTLPDLSASGLGWDTTAFTTYGIVVVTPEPSRALFLMLGLFGLLMRRRRSLRSSFDL